MSKIFKWWAIGAIITTLILVFVCGVGFVYIAISHYCPLAAIIIKFGTGFLLTSFLVGFVAWVIHELDKDSPKKVR